MSLKIKKAAVLGAGVMGAQIAAHLANAGVRTYLLDLESDNPVKDPKLAKVVGKNLRSQRAIIAIEQLKQLKPAPFVSESVLPNIIPGNFADDWSVLAEADWIIEAVIEKLDIKQAIHQRISEVARPHVPVTTNTSGISLLTICKDFSEHYQKCFFGSHFFNPPRYMKLVEIVPHDNTDRQLMEELAEWIAARLGKGIVYARDTVNFIANRIGVFNIMTTLKHMASLKLNIETVDALTGKLMGRPPSATFRTMDVVGLDTLVHVAKNVYDIEKNDPYRELFFPPAWLLKLIEKGHVGQKSGNVGCYKKSKDQKGNTVILAYRPDSETYVPQEVKTFRWFEEASKIQSIFERFNFILKQDDEGAAFVSNILLDTFSYSALLLNEIANDKPLALDEAMQWGFNWEWGPLQIWQGMGYEAVLKRMQKEKIKLPSWIKPQMQFYKPSPETIDWQATGAAEQLLPTKNNYKKILKPPYQYHLPKFQNAKDLGVVTSNPKASLVDIGDGVACLVFHSKMNAIDQEIIDLTQSSIDRVEKQFQALVIGSDGQNFSAGANLKMFVELINKKDFSTMDKVVRHFQGTLQTLKYAPFPSIACPQGLTLGGGCEVSLHCTDQVLTTETYAGLVEVGVGVLPAGGGTKELALRAYQLAESGERADPMAFLQRAFLLIGMARTSTSGYEAIEMGLYPQKARFSISRDHQIDRAKKLALSYCEMGYSPPIPRLKVKVVGDPGIQTFKLMLYNMVEGKMISSYDAFIGEKIATVLCGGTIDAGQYVSEHYFLDLERNLFVELCKQEKTKARIEHMLATSKPLRN